MSKNPIKSVLQAARRAARNAAKGTVKFVKSASINPADWIPAPKGTPGHKERQFILKNAKTAADQAKRLSYYQMIKAKSGGKTPAQLAEERAPQRPSAERTAYALKRREAADKRRQYNNEESIKDIRWFERFKETRRKRHEGVNGKEEGGAVSSEDYARGKAMAEKYADLDKDFLKYVSSPPKKRETRRKLDAQGRNVRDMRRSNRPSRHPGSRKAA
jgi:hypothetical protein